MVYLIVHFVIIFSAISEIRNAYLLNITTDHQYQDSTITCPSGEDCTVLCGAPYSCSNATIHCPAGHICNIDCKDKEHACITATFNCQESSACNIHCKAAINSTATRRDGIRTCWGSHINCPNALCDVSCFGRYTCMHAFFDVPLGGSLNALCNGIYACANSYFKCPGDEQQNECNIDCPGSYRQCYQISHIYVVAPTPMTTSPTLYPSSEPTQRKQTTDLPTTAPTKFPTPPKPTLTVLKPTSNPTKEPGPNPSKIHTISTLEIATATSDIRHQGNDMDNDDLYTILIIIIILIVLIIFGILCLFRLLRGGPRRDQRLKNMQIVQNTVNEQQANVNRVMELETNVNPSGDMRRNNKEYCDEGQTNKDYDECLACFECGIVEQGKIVEGNGEFYCFDCCEKYEQQNGQITNENIDKEDGNTLGFNDEFEIIGDDQITKQ